MIKLFFVLIVISIVVLPVIGKTAPNWLIINGVPAEVGDIPSIVSIQHKTQRGPLHNCGGTLIDWSFVLTASHCVLSPDGRDQIEPSYLRIAAGDISIADVGSDARQIRDVKQLFPHPLYDSATVKNDIALIQLSEPFDESDTVDIIPLSNETPPDNQNCIVAGWGSILEDPGIFPDLLQKVDVEIYLMSFCNSSQSYDGQIPLNTVCAGAIGNKNILAVDIEDACQGDSGGPLICNDEITGVVSYGYGCGRGMYPGIYTDVSKFIPWIENTIRRSAEPETRGHRGGQFRRGNVRAVENKLQTRSHSTKLNFECIIILAAIIVSCMAL